MEKKTDDEKTYPAFDGDRRSICRSIAGGSCNVPVCDLVDQEHRVWFMASFSWLFYGRRLVVFSAHERRMCKYDGKVFLKESDLNRYPLRIRMTGHFLRVIRS